MFPYQDKDKLIRIRTDFIILLKLHSGYYDLVGGLSLFDSRRADLSGISKGLSLAVERIVQKVHIRVEEEGTEASAA